MARTDKRQGCESIEYTPFMQNSKWINKKCKYYKELPDLCGFKRRYCQNPAVIELTVNGAMVRGCVKHKYKNQGNCALIKRVYEKKAGERRKRRKRVFVHYSDFTDEQPKEIFIDYVNGHEIVDVVRRHKCNGWIINKVKKDILNKMGVGDISIWDVRKNKQKYLEQLT